MGNRRLGRKRLGAVLAQGLNANVIHSQLSSTDDWGLVRPAGIAHPGIQRNIKSIQLHPGSNTDVADLGAEDANSTIWLFDADGGSATIALKGDHADFTDGAITCTTHTDANDTSGITMPNFPFDCRSGKKWWIEACFQVGDLDDCEFFFGLHEEQYASQTNLSQNAGGVGDDTIALVKATHNSGAITNLTSRNGDDSATALTTGLTIANDSDVVRLAIHWDGSGLKYYGSISTTDTGYQSEAMALVATETNTANISEAGVKLALSLQIASAGSAEVLTINYLRGAWEI